MSATNVVEMSEDCTIRQERVMDGSCGSYELFFFFYLLSFIFYLISLSVSVDKVPRFGKV